MRDLEQLEVVVDFLSPFEDKVDVVVIGDKITDELYQEIGDAFNNLRDLFNQIPAMVTSENKLGTVNMYRFTTDELFRGLANEQLKTYSTIYLDPDLSSHIINILNAEEHMVDELDAMLLDKYLLQVPQEKYLLDISKTNQDSVNKLLLKMDNRPADFNYIIYGNVLAIWIYWNDDISLIQIE